MSFHFSRYYVLLRSDSILLSLIASAFRSISVLLSLAFNYVKELTFQGSAFALDKIFVFENFVGIFFEITLGLVLVQLQFFYFWL